MFTFLGHPGKKVVPLIVMPPKKRARVTEEEARHEKALEDKKAAKAAPHSFFQQVARSAAKEPKSTASASSESASSASKAEALDAPIQGDELLISALKSAISSTAEVLDPDTFQLILLSKHAKLHLEWMVPETRTVGAFARSALAMALNVPMPARAISCATWNVSTRRFTMQ